MDVFEYYDDNVQLAMPARYLTYRPNTVRSLFTAHSSQAEIFAFSAKERDAETGLSYFGARYYSSDLSIWLSVDPMSDKYPSLSPYVYCADNPVRCVDPNGEDFDPVFNDNENTLTINAVYYTSKEDYSSLKGGIDLWNSQSDKYTYTLGEGENAKTYTIKFNLQAKICDNFEEAQQLIPKDGCSNIFSVSNGDFEENGLSDGFNIFVKPQATRHTVAHEIGHTLGIGDCFLNTGLMLSGNQERDALDITEDHIRSILTSAGIRVDSYKFTPTKDVFCKHTYFEWFIKNLPGQLKTN